MILKYLYSIVVMSVLALSASANDDSDTSPDAGYRLKIGDRIKVDVYDEPDLTQTFQVKSGGTVRFRFIGNVDTNGHTLESLEKLLIEKYSEGYLKKPQISVTVHEFRSYFINGAVVSGGSFKFEEGLSVRKAIAQAGGLSERGTWGKIYLKREDSDSEIRIDEDKLELVVKPGDIITIGETLF